MPVSSGATCVIGPREPAAADRLAIEELEKVEDDWDRSKAGTNDGAPLEIEVTVPAHYPDEVLRGREVLLRFVLEKTQTAELPELDDEAPAARLEPPRPRPLLPAATPPFFLSGPRLFSGSAASAT